MATANEPSAGIDVAEQRRRSSSAQSACRSARRCRPAPRRAPRAAGRPRPSPVPCSTLEAIIAPNIQLAGNFSEPQQQRDGDRGGDQRGQFERRGDRSRDSAGGADGAIPVSASTSGSAAVRMITRMVCTTAIAGTSAPLLDREHGDLRQRAGAAGQQRRGPVPAMDALQIKAGAEGRAEGRERQQADGQRIGADMCWISCRDTSEPSEMPSSTSTVWVRIGGTASGRPASAAMPTAIIAPEISPPGRLRPQKQQAAGGADRRASRAR